MKLYFAPNTCSLAPHLVVHEAGLAGEVALEKVDLKTKRTASGAEYLSIERKGYVPALALDDGTVLTESAAILQYLADLVPERGLAPACGTRARYELQSWLNFVATEVHKAWSPLWHKHLDPAVHALAREKIARRLDDLEARLATQPFLMGEGFSVADAYLFAITHWARWTAVDLSRWPSVAAHHARIADRPATQAAIAAERALK
jgi:glutathione S-transferase